jgi:hypothetical protein
MKRRHLLIYPAVAAILLLQGSCALMFKSLTTGGEEQLKPAATATAKAVRGLSYSRLMAPVPIS